MSLKNKIIIKSYPHQNNNKFRYPARFYIIDQCRNQKDLHDVQHFPKPEGKYRQAKNK